MDYEKGKILIEYENIEYRDYVVEQLGKLGLNIDRAFKYIPHLSVKCESCPKGLEEKILAIEFEGEKIIKKIRKVGMIRALNDD